MGYQKKDNRIVYIKNIKNLKLISTLNKGIEKSNWEYIARIDDDDIWSDSKKLEAQVEFMQNNPNCWLCWTCVIMIDEEWNILGKETAREYDEDIRKNILWINQFAHSSVIMPTSIARELGGYKNEKWTLHAEDYDFRLRIASIKETHNLMMYWLKYRVRKASISNKNYIKQQTNSLLIALKYINHFPNKIIWIIKHLAIILLPKKTIKQLVRFKTSSSWKK